MEGIYMSNIQIYPKAAKLNNEVYMMPWESDAICCNFNEPEVFILKIHRRR